MVAFVLAPMTAWALQSLKTGEYQGQGGLQRPNATHWVCDQHIFKVSLRPGLSNTNSMSSSMDTENISMSPCLSDPCFDWEGRTVKNSGAQLRLDNLHPFVPGCLDGGT